MNLSATDEMKSIMERLISAAEHLDADGVLALCRPSDEFLAVIDGVISTYAQFEAAERAAFKVFKRHKLTFDSLLYRALGEGAVAATALFHQQLTDANGNEIRLKGEFTWIATQSADGLWRLAFVHACHMPDTDPVSA